MEILDAEEQTSEVVPDHFGGHGLHFANDVEHFLAVNILHDKIDIFLIVECLDKAYDIGEYNLLQDLLLLDDTILQLLILDVLLGNALDCVEVGTELNVLDEVDLPKLTLS